MGVIINIDEALRLRKDYNILKEPLNDMIKNYQEAWEKQNPIDFLYARRTIDRFQKTFVDSVGFDKAFVETNDYSLGPIFNTEDGFSATYTTRTFQGSFIITQQVLEDADYGVAKDNASKFVKRWHGDLVEYAMAAISSGFGSVVEFGGQDGKGVSRLKLNSADTTDGDIATETKNPLFTNKHTIVKRKGKTYIFNAVTALTTVTNCQSNKFYAPININGTDPARIAKLADIINQVITYMENLRDDNGKRAGVLGAKTIVTGNDAHLKAAIETALAMDQFKQGESMYLNPGYKRATLETTPYLNDIPQCANGIGFFIIDKSYNNENHGLEFTERIPFTLDVVKQDRPKGIIYDGRQRMDINVATWRGISYVYLGTPAGNVGMWDELATFTEVIPIETIVRPVSVVGEVKTV